MEEDFALQKEDDRGFSHPSKPSLSAAHPREQVLALSSVLLANYLIAVWEKLFLIYKFTRGNEQKLLFVLGL